MKTCDETQARLSAYLDGEAREEEESIRAHVHSCDACRRTLDAFRRVSGRIRDVEPAPATLVEDIRRRVRRAKTAVPKFAAAAAILAALLWAAVVLGDASDRSSNLPESAPSGDLSETERRILYGKPPTEDEWMAILLREGDRR